MRYFLDFEFVESEWATIPISVGVACHDGRMYYAQYVKTGFTTLAGDWVARNVYPHLKHFDLARQERSCVAKKAPAPSELQLATCYEPGCPWRYVSDVKKELAAFCDPEKYGEPEFWAWYADYDWTLLCKTFGSMLSLPDGWPMYCLDLKQWAVALGNPPLPEQQTPEHHALNDALHDADLWEELAIYERNHG